MTTQNKVTSGISLIGIYGHARAGKDTAKDFICDNFKNHYFTSFADSLKESAAAAFGIPSSHFYSEDTKEMTNPYWGVSPRQIAQFLGTEMFRDTISKLLPDIGNDFWIRRTLLRLNNDYVPDTEGEFEYGDTVVIPDVRFQNEYDFIIENGGIIIHLTRPGADGNIGIPNHPSESSLDLHTKERTYTCVNDSSLQDLHLKLANIIVSLRY